MSHWTPCQTEKKVYAINLKSLKHRKPSLKKGYILVWDNMWIIYGTELYICTAAYSVFYVVYV